MIDFRKRPCTCFLGLVIAMGIMLIYVIDVNLLVHNWSNAIVFRETKIQDTQKFSEETSVKGYVIKTPGCSIPDLKPMDPLIVPFIFDENPIVCNNGRRPLFESNRTAIYLLLESFGDYNITNVEALKCCHQYFKRKTPDDDEADKNVQYEDECIEFVNSIEVNVSKQFVRVKCAYDGDIYTDFFNFIPVKNDSTTINADENQINVLVLGIDAMSRLNFHRQMPKTAFYLKKLEAVELLGYNKVGDNTFPNLVVALSGHNEEELQNICWPDSDAFFDECDFIWKHYKKAGYTTAFGEDSSWMGLFYYTRSGFKQQPTDYFYDHFDMTATREIGNRHRMNVDECIGSRPAHQIFWHYIEEFVRVMHENSKTFFAFFWSSTLSHDYLNKPKLGDQDYLNLLFNLDEEGILNKTALIVMSDHGIRWGDIRSTYQGAMEERLPFLYVVLPEWYRNEHPEYYNNLRRNSRRLTSPYDLHETFLDLLGTIEAESDKNRSSTSRGISLFSTIPKGRTCDDAGIEQHWCTCQASENLSVNDTNIIESVNFTINQINTMLIGYSDCHQLVLDDILNARELIANKESTNYRKPLQDFGITFKTKPGGAIFEATVRKELENDEYVLSITGTISRLNLYGEQSKCISDFHLKLYCFCRSYLS